MRSLLSRALLHLMSLFLFALSFFQSQPLQAQIYYFPPYVNHGWHQSAYPFGFGYFAYGNWPNHYWNFPNLNGYSYYTNYYNYQPVYSNFAAIAYSPSLDQTGYAYGWQTRIDASNQAVVYCNSIDCQPVSWVQGGCTAVASDKKYKAIGWAYATNRSVAEQGANSSCASQVARLPVAEGQAANISACTVKGWVCTQ